MNSLNLVISISGLGLIFLGCAKLKYPYIALADYLVKRLIGEKNYIKYSKMFGVIFIISGIIIVLLSFIYPL